MPRFTWLAGACLLTFKLRSIESTTYVLTTTVCHTKDLPQVTQLFSGVRKIDLRGRSRPEEGSSRDK